MIQAYNQKIQDSTSNDPAKLSLYREDEDPDEPVDIPIESPTLPYE